MQVMLKTMLLFALIALLSWACGANSAQNGGGDTDTDTDTDAEQSLCYSSAVEGNIPRNYAPVLDQTINYSVDVGDLLSFTVSATDVDDAVLTYCIDTLPTGASFDSETGAFSWTPAEADIGTYHVMFTVSDGQLADSRNVHIVVMGAAGILDTIPANLMVPAVNAYNISISWIPPDGDDAWDVIGYNIYRDDVLVGTTTDTTTISGGTIVIGLYDDNSNLSPETEYTYTVTALYDGLIEGDPSYPISATTLAEPTYVNPASEVIPIHSIGDWTSAGVVGGIPDYPVGVNVMDYGAAGDGVADDTTAIKDAIAACPEGSAVLLPAGTYLTTSVIELNKQIVLRGEGPAATILQHNHSGLAIVFRAGANYAGIEDMHVQTLYSTGGGTGIELRDVNNSWIKNIEKSGHREYQVGLVESSHCTIRDSYIHNSYEQCVVDNNWSHSYGIYIFGNINQSNNTNPNNEADYNLVENNVLDWFSANLLAQYRTNHNVFAYNFSWTIWGDPGAYSTRTGFSLHHYDYQNNSPPFDHTDPAPHKFAYYTLCEGNLLEGAVIGMNRQRNNTFFRTRFTHSGVYLIFDNFAFGNEFTAQKNPTTSTFSHNDPMDVDRGSIEHGNYITEDSRGLEWDATIDDHNIPDSFYLTEKPAFFGDLTWPPYGGDIMNAGSAINEKRHRSPAEVRYWSILHPEITPSDLEATTNGNDVTLTWTNNSTNNVNFIIVRSTDTDSGNCKRIDVTDLNVETYTDTVPAAGQYYYYVKAVNRLGGLSHPGGEALTTDLGGESEPSGEVMVIVE